MRDFEDHFSRRARTYVQFRPSYPPELYAYLASLAPHRWKAWDCGTGNGQAALGLARHFERVVATDASPEQITMATLHEGVEYKVARSEQSGLPAGSMALVTCAVAVHWFDFDAFYAEVRRVLSPRGIIALWCYSLPTVEPAIDGITERYMRKILSDYWPERFRYILEEYRTLPFPFEELTAPGFGMETMWDMNQLLGFLQSWSGTVSYEKREGRSPLDLIRPELAASWGPATEKRLLRWRLHIRLGRVT